MSYINHVADRFELWDDIQLNTRVEAAIFDEESGRWRVRTENGTATGRYCIMAAGCLSIRNSPDFQGLDSFAGPWYHTGEWPHEGVDFSGQRVAVIGTGSSAIQAIPLIAEEAEHLTVFQRTPNYSVPARNGPLDPEVKRRIKADYAGFRASNKLLPFGAEFRHNEKVAAVASPVELEAEYVERWAAGGLPFLAAFTDLIFDKAANDTAAEFIRGKIRETVNDPKVAELLLTETTVGCKRMCVDTDYFATYNRDNVTLVDIRNTPIEQITAAGVRVSGEEYPADCIVFAIGFDAMTGALLNIDIRGVGGVTLNDKWAEGPRTYLGLGTAGFPNLFCITGPGSPSVLSNMVPAIEQHVDWIADCIDYMSERGLARIEPTVEAEDQWVAHVNEVAEQTLYPTCNSWYRGSNVPGKPRVFLPYLGYPPYVEKCDAVAAAGYEGFMLSAN